MAPNYALAYVNPSGQERFLLKGTTESGGQHVSKAEAKELSDELCFFASVDDIRRFLQQDSSVRPVDHAPYIFHFDPAKNRTFRVYQVIEGIMQDEPAATLRNRQNDPDKLQ